MQDIQEPVIESVGEVLPISRRASLARFARRISGAQFVRYVLVGIWNTAIGYGLFAYFTFLFTKHSVHGYMYAGRSFHHAISITVAFFGYKFFVFRTKGNYSAGVHPLRNGLRQRHNFPGFLSAGRDEEHHRPLRHAASA